MLNAPDTPETTTPPWKAALLSFNSTIYTNQA